MVSHAVTEPNFIWSHALTKGSMTPTSLPKYSLYTMTRSHWTYLIGRESVPRILALPFQPIYQTIPFTRVPARRSRIFRTLIAIFRSREDEMPKHIHERSSWKFQGKCQAYGSFTPVEICHCSFHYCITKQKTVRFSHRCILVVFSTDWWVMSAYHYIALDDSTKDRLASHHQGRISL